MYEMVILAMRIGISLNPVVSTITIICALGYKKS